MAKHSSHILAVAELRKVLLLVIAVQTLLGLMGRCCLIQCFLKTESSSSCHFLSAAYLLTSPYTVEHD